MYLDYIETLNGTGSDVQIGDKAAKEAGKSKNTQSPNSSFNKSMYKYFDLHNK